MTVLIKTFCVLVLTTDDRSGVGSGARAVLAPAHRRLRIQFQVGEETCVCTDIKQTFL